MPISKEENRSRVKASREALIARIGIDVYRQQENQKRKLRRERQRARSAPSVAPTPAPAPVRAPVYTSVPIRVRTNNIPFTPTTVALERSVAVNVSRVPPKVRLEKTVPISIPTLEEKHEQKEEKEQKTQDDACETLFEKVYQAKVKYYDNMLIPKTIKKDSVAQQFKKITNLYKKMFQSSIDCNNLDFLKNTKKVIDFINKHYKTANSRNSQVQAIASILQVLPEYKDEYMFYSKFSTDERQKITKEAEKNLTTAKESENILAWGDLKNLHKKKEMTPEHRALISLYTMIPPRRLEYQALTITDTEVNHNDNLNYLVVKHGIPTKLIFNKYKTKQTYNVQEFDIKKDLASVLKPYITDKKPGDLVFSTKNNKQIKNFGEYLTNIFKKYTGKNITVNLIRHSFVSDFLKKNKSIANRKKISTMMAHSIDQQSFYNRIDLKS